MRIFNTNCRVPEPSTLRNGLEDMLKFGVCIALTLGKRSLCLSAGVNGACGAGGVTIAKKCRSALKFFRKFTVLVSYN